MCHTTTCPDQDADFPPLRFQKPDTAFLPALKQRVDAYFTSRGKHRYADHRMIGKTVFLFCVWGVCCAIIYSNRLQGLALIGPRYQPGAPAATDEDPAAPTCAACGSWESRRNKKEATRLRITSAIT